MNLFMKTMIVVFVPQMTSGGNIMKDKPSKQSSTYSSYVSTHANDGNDYTRSMTKYEESPYWQGDLLDFYSVFNITIRRVASAYIKSAYIGVSALDVADPESDVLTCGQWPSSDTQSSRTFKCCLRQPVRFVRIWREDKYYLAFSEVAVEAESEPTSTAFKYRSMKSNRLTAPIISLTVSMVTECGTLCYKKQLCKAFSFRQGEQLNCLLGTGQTTTPDTNWVTYVIKDCSKPPICHGAIDPDY